ncbi:hypothetical protein Tco_0522327 [Tanacetum coccineum]
MYISCIEQFWSTVKAKTINGEVQLHALVDGKKITITESTVRRDLQLEDAEGVDCLPNSTIFEQLTLMGSKTTAWNEFSSTMASENEIIHYELARGNTPQSDEDRLKLDELMALCTTSINRILDLEKTKTSQANEIASLKRRVKKLEKKNRSRTLGCRMYKVDEEITLVSVQDDVDKEVFDVDALNGKRILIEPVKKKDQMLLDEETTLKLQAEFDKEERLEREKAEKVEEANIVTPPKWVA